jgi:hypothetical protein
MKVHIYSCRTCGGALKILEGQAITHCRHCGSFFYISDDSPKVVVLRPEIEMKNAKQIILKGLRHRSVSKTFLKNSFFEKATLFFIPFFEVRGIKAGWNFLPGAETDEYEYQAFDFLEKANDLAGINIGLVDYSAVEESILKAKQIPFDVPEMRKSGVVLPFRELKSFKNDQFQRSGAVVEIHYRIVYFPVWEIGYTYRGIIFKSYLSAGDGRILKLHALKNHQLKLLLSIGGLFGLATLISRSFKMAFILTHTPVMGFSFFFLIVLFPLLLFVTALLFPYLWRLFAFREELVIRGKWVESFPINYTENSLIRFSRVFSEKFSRLFDSGNRGDN